MHLKHSHGILEKTRLSFMNSILSLQKVQGAKQDLKVSRVFQKFHFVVDLDQFPAADRENLNAYIGFSW